MISFIVCYWQFGLSPPSVPDRVLCWLIAALKLDMIQVATNIVPGCPHMNYHNSVTASSEEVTIAPGQKLHEKRFELNYC